MGQRTILVITEETFGLKKAYHCQWGIGRITLNHALAYLLNNSDLTFEAPVPLKKLEEYNSNMYMQPPRLIDITEEIDFKDAPVDLLDCINQHDNNNGGVHLFIKRNKYGSIESGSLTIANYLKSEGDPEVYQYVTFTEWCKNELNVDYCNHNWKVGFVNMMENFNIEMAV